MIEVEKKYDRVNDQLYKYINENDELKKKNQKLDYELVNEERKHTIEVKDLKKKIKDAEIKNQDINLDN